MNAASSPLLWLASRSPRRGELLEQLGVRFARIDVEVDESCLDAEAPADYVRRVALLKAATPRADGDERVILAADTCVSVGGEIFGKPRDFTDAKRMLRCLSGRWHTVYTAVVLSAPQAPPEVAAVATRVEFVILDDALIAAYWGSGEPADKAGAYGIQGLGGALVRGIEGSYSAVVGLPLAETRALLDGAGVRHALSGGLSQS
ncbi:MAG: Maf family protein [Gammaproteobacteria bacterium]